MVVTAVVFVLVVGGGYFAWTTFVDKAPVETVPTTPEVPVMVDESLTYASTTMGIAVKYPKEYVLNDAFSNTSVNPQKPIHGVKFTLPVEMATGTNLSADSGISIEQLPRANKCSGDIYLAANVKSRDQVEGNIIYSFASSSDAGAGNLYEEYVYAISSSTPCTAVRYFIHTTQIANYPTGTVREFDRAALIAAFDKIRQSLVLQ